MKIFWYNYYNKVKSITLRKTNNFLLQRRKNMAKVLSEKSLLVWNFLKNNQGANLTAADIAAQTGLDKKTVDGVVTSGLKRKGYADRFPAEVEVEGGLHKLVKFIKLTEAGEAYDHDAALKADNEAMMAKMKEKE